MTDSFENEMEIEEELDIFTEFLQSMEENFGKPTISIADREGEELVKNTYTLFRYLTRVNKNTEVSYKINEPFVGVGSVEIITDQININNPSWLSKLMEMANTFEVYPRTDGKIQMNIGFFGISKPIA